ncbi:hypothetical protein BGZ81_007916 [Podila clonocystis]|nr:hypothetical protein BGZ81_007916 [Podila clonocystis]
MPLPPIQSSLPRYLFNQMGMNLIPWSDLKSVRASDLDLYVCGRKLNTKWLDSVVVEGNMCKISVEICCPIQKAPQVHRQCYVRPKHQPQHQLYYPPQQHSSLFSMMIDGVEEWVKAAFENTIDLGIQFFFGC